MRESTRLNKYIAERLGLSRREADDLISAGKVTLNGETAALGNKVSPGDKVAVSGKELPEEVEYTYYAFNKPVGYVCSRKPQGGDPSIYDLLPPEMKSMKNVGRLDRTSSGLMLLTNDGDFGFQMTHPSFVKHKVYEVTLHKPLEKEDRERITGPGVELSDGVSRFEVTNNPNPPQDMTRRQVRTQNRILHEAIAAAAQARKKARRPDATPEDKALAEELAKKAEALEKSKKTTPDGLHVIVTLTEGRNRQIRRTFAALGYNILSLHRIEFGDYKLGDLESGKFRKIEKKIML